MDDRDPRLEEALAKLAGGDEEPSAQRLAAAREAVSQDTGLLSTLRQLPRLTRVALAGIALGSLALLVGLFSAREDLGAYPVLRLALEVGSSIVLALLVTNLVLRGPHRTAPAPGLTWGLAGAAVGLPAVFAFAPPADLMLPGAKGGEGAFVKEVMSCFVYGSAAALSVLGTLAVLQRLPPTRARVSVLAAAGAGLGGVLALQMHCPIAVRDHLLMGHVTVPLAVVLAVLFVRRALGGSDAS